MKSKDTLELPQDSGLAQVSFVFGHAGWAVNRFLCMERSVLAELENEPKSVFCMFHRGIDITDDCVFSIILEPV
jgi:hypothetical protein